MFNLNEVRLLGNVYKDPVQKMIGTTPMVSFQLVVGRSYKDKTTGEWKNSPAWLTCNIFGKKAEYFMLDIIKGDNVFVTGYINTSTSKKDGVTKYYTAINCDDYTKTFKAPKKGNVPEEFTTDVTQVDGDEVQDLSLPF